MEPNEEKSHVYGGPFSDDAANLAEIQKPAGKSSISAVISIIGGLIIVFVRVSAQYIAPFLRSSDGNWGPSESAVIFILFILLVHVVCIFSGFLSIFRKESLWVLGMFGMLISIVSFLWR